MLQKSVKIRTRVFLPNFLSRTVLVRPRRKVWVTLRVRASSRPRTCDSRRALGRCEHLLTCKRYARTGIDSIQFVCTLSDVQVACTCPPMFRNVPGLAQDDVNPLAGFKFVLSSWCSVVDTCLNSFEYVFVHLMCFKSREARFFYRCRRFVQQGSRLLCWRPRFVIF